MLIKALLLTIDVDQFRNGPDPDPRLADPIWLRWDEDHYVAPLGTRVPAYGHVDRIEMDTWSIRNEQGG